MSCKRWICWDGRPKSKLVQKSKWHITKAWIRRSVVVLSKKSRILPILYNPNDAERHFCDTKFSKVTPKFLHIFAEWTGVPSKFSVDIGLVNLWREEPWRNSVLIPPFLGRVYNYYISLLKARETFTYKLLKNTPYLLFRFLSGKSSRNKETAKNTPFPEKMVRRTRPPCTFEWGGGGGGGSYTAP